MISGSLLLAIMAMTFGLSDGTATQGAEAEFTALRDSYLGRWKPLWLESQQAWWEANTTGSDSAFARKKVADKALVELYGDKETFAKLKSLKDGGKIADPVMKRELDVMYRAYLPGQGDPTLRKKIVDLENDVEQLFNTHRSKVGDKTLTENDIRQILSTSTKSDEAAAAWKGYMEVGVKAEPTLRMLARMRNELAKQLGFPHFHALSLALQEINETEFFELFDELDTLTREPFAKAKADMDARQAKKFGIAVADLRPWHYEDLFFQEARQVDDTKLDDIFKNADIIELVKQYYAGLGLPCDDIVARSDLLEKPGKSPHAFCTHLDREGDIRVLCNLKPNLYWADTTFHEIGHGVYDKYISKQVPFLLREPAHSITTEGIAMMFGSVVKNGEWLVKGLKLDPKDAERVTQSAKKTLRVEKLMFARWTQVMVRFEHGLYTNPDQNLGKLWWDLKKKYQLLNPPESVDRPDYAAKVHILTNPVYYHSYLMGELFAAQARNYAATKVVGLKDAKDASFLDQPKAGEYFRDKIFAPGNLYPWSELCKKATGEPMSAKYFAKQYVE